MSGSNSRGGSSGAPYSAPPGDADVVVGTATYNFLTAPMIFRTWEFIGIAFIIFVVARHWGRFVNDIAL